MDDKIDLLSVRERLTEIANRDSAVSVTVRADDLRAILSAPVVEPEACTLALMKIAADLANRKPLSQLYRICDTQGRISAESLHEHLDKAGDLLAGIALDIRHTLAKQPTCAKSQVEPSSPAVERQEPFAWVVVSPDGKEFSELQSSQDAAKDLAHDLDGELHALHDGGHHEVKAVFLESPAPVSVAPILVEAVAVTRECDEDGLRLEWLLEGGIAALELPGAVLFVAHGTVTNDEGHGYVIPVEGGNDE